MKYEFVELIPENINEGTLYISLMYSTAVHNCFCGCGSEVVTPLSPIDWKFTYDGETISLFPSVGNWSLPCKSHYWIERGKVRWAEGWSEDRIKASRKYQQRNAEGYWTEQKGNFVEKIIVGVRKLFN